MTPSAFRPAHALSGRTWAGLLLIALVLRAFVPGGYMPDPAARAQGLINLALCTAHDGGASSAIARDTPDGHHDTTSRNCPLCVLAHQAWASPPPAQTAPIPASRFILIERPAAPRGEPVLGLRGAPLGARAPPALST